MKLYSFFQSSASYRVRIALNLKAIAPETVYVDLSKGEQKSPAYAALNPQKMIPSLVVGDAVLTQSLAIMEYLDEAYPETYRLLPGSAAARAHIRAIALSIAADISPLGNLKIRQYVGRAFGATPEEVKQKWLQHWIADGLAALEQQLYHSPHTGTFCVGDTPTMADCCLVPQIFVAKRWEVDTDAYPTLMRIHAACEALPAFAAAHPSQQPDAPPPAL